jgi:sigma-B regulation protein RsbU (phosphoserine phosphatase)
MMFITFFIGVLDLTSGSLHYCNAGHNKPFLVSDSITELPAKPDLPLGVSDEASFVVRECTLPAGAMLFLYTDGLTEAMNGQREQFGRQRLIDNLKSGADSQSQIEKMTQAVHQFVGDAPQSDDLTMLTIRYLNQNTTPDNR